VAKKHFANQACDRGTGKSQYRSRALAENLVRHHYYFKSRPTGSRITNLRARARGHQTASERWRTGGTGCRSRNGSNLFMR